jgi:hypothetical protein
MERFGMHHRLRIQNGSIMEPKSNPVKQEIKGVGKLSQLNLPPVYV